MTFYFYRINFLFYNRRSGGACIAVLLKRICVNAFINSSEPEDAHKVNRYRLMFSYRANKVYFNTL